MNSSIQELLKLDGYSISQIRDLQDAKLCFEHVVLPRKIKREAKAAEVLREFKGKYTKDKLDEIFNLADNDPTGPWFEPLLSRPNRNNLYRNPMIELNNLIDKLLENGDLGWLGQWRRTGNRGMSAGIATLFMYLFAPHSYNIWLPKNHSGLSKLYQLDARRPKHKELSPEEYTIFYKRFNDKAVGVCKENGLVPQSIDWFLWAVNEIKENPNNRHLRAYIEGTTK